MRKILLTGFIILLISSAAVADIIVLKNGNRLRGRITDRDKLEIVIEMPYGTMVIKRSNIDRVILEKEKDYLLGQAERLAQRRYFDKALDHYKKALKDDPGDDDIRIAIEDLYAKMMRYYIDKRNVDSATDAHKALQKFNPHSPAALMEVTLLKQLVSEIADEEARAVRLLTQGKPDEAIGVLKGLLVHMPGRQSRYFPRLAQAYIESAEALLRKNNYLKAASKYDQAIGYNPTVVMIIERAWVFCKANVVFDLLRKKQNDKAKKEADDILRAIPDNLIGLFAMGDILWNQKRREEARDYYMRSLGGETSGAPAVLADLREHARKVLIKKTSASNLLAGDPRLTGVDGPGWKTISTDNFTIRHRNAYAAGRIAKLAEHYRGIINGYLDMAGARGSWKMKCEIELYPDRASYRKRKLTMEWSGGTAVIETVGSKLKRHGIILFQTSPQIYNSILPHELTHLIFQRVVGFDKKIPLWVNEGAAQWMESSLKHKYLVRVLAMEIGTRRMYGLKKLARMKNYPRDKTRRDIFYAQSYFATRCLVEKGGAGRLVKFTRRLSSGEDFVKLLRELYGIPNVLAFEKLFNKKLGEEVRRCGFTSSSGGTSK